MQLCKDTPLVFFHLSEVNRNGVLLQAYLSGLQRLPRIKSSGEDIRERISIELLEPTFKSLELTNKLIHRDSNTRGIPNLQDNLVELQVLHLEVEELEGLPMRSWIKHLHHHRRVI